MFSTVVLAHTLYQTFRLPFRLSWVDREGEVPCGQVHWDRVPLIELRSRSAYGEDKALIHEYAHVLSDDQGHGLHFEIALYRIEMFLKSH